MDFSAISHLCGAKIRYLMPPASVIQTFQKRDRRVSANCLKILIPFRYVRFRETEFTQEYTDKPVVNVLDPTLLLDAEDYAKIAVKPKENIIC